jgi:hypothetical protein
LKKGTTVRLRDELPEWLTKGRGVGPAFEVGAVEELDDGLADLAAARHCGK